MLPSGECEDFCDTDLILSGKERRGVERRYITKMFKHYSENATHHYFFLKRMKQKYSS